MRNFDDNLLYKSEKNNYKLDLLINYDTKVFCNQTKKFIDLSINNLSDFIINQKFIIELNSIYCYNSKIHIILILNTIIINEKSKKIINIKFIFEKRILNSF